MRGRRSAQMWVKVAFRETKGIKNLSRGKLEKGERLSGKKRGKTLVNTILGVFWRTGRAKCRGSQWLAQTAAIHGGE